MINRIKGHFEEVDEDKYFIVSSKNSDIMQKYQEVFNGIKEIIKKVNDYSQPIKYDGKYMKIKFNTLNLNFPSIFYSFSFNYYNNKICQKKG